MTTLVELQNHHQFSTDKNSRHTYLKHYDQWFLPYKDKPIKLLEIGMASGGSMVLWSKYFSSCTFFGLDIDVEQIIYTELWMHNNVFIIPKNFETLDVSSLGDIKFDIIIDDGSHILNHQIKCFEIFKNKLSPNGILVIEDIQHYNLEPISLYTKNIKNTEILDLRHENGVEDNILWIFNNR